jgi:hypothetical protein
MSWLRLTVLGCLVLSLTGCSTWTTGNKDKANAAKSGAGNVSREEQKPAYDWSPPREDVPRSQLPQAKPEERASF